VEDAVYRIYRNGVPYTKKDATQNIKTVYVKEGSAKSVVTSEVGAIARLEYTKGDPRKSYFSLTAGERAALEAEIRKQFKVVKYVPEKEQTT